MLSEFYVTVEDFEVNLGKASRKLAEWDGVCHFQRFRMQDLGRDMISLREAFVRAHINATMWAYDREYDVNRAPNPTSQMNVNITAYLLKARAFDKQETASIEAYLEQSRKKMERLARQQLSRAAEESEKSTWELKVIYKAYFLFIRAFHDACYGVFLNIAGLTTGKLQTMSSCIKKEIKSPVYQHVSKIHGYVEWFKNFKKMRDTIKMGVDPSLCGPCGDIGIGFNRKITPEGGISIDCGTTSNLFRIRDLISAFQYSTALLESISRAIPNR